MNRQIMTDAPNDLQRTEGQIDGLSDGLSYRREVIRRSETELDRLECYHFGSRRACFGGFSFKSFLLSYFLSFLLPLIMRDNYSLGNLLILVATGD